MKKAKKETREIAFVERKQDKLLSLKKRLDAAAKKENLTVSDILRRAAYWYLDSCEKIK